MEPERKEITLEAEYLYRQARENVEYERYDQAVSILRETVEAYPQYLPALVELGNCYDSLSQFDEAVGIYERAIELDPHDADVWFNKGMSLKRMGCDDESGECVRRAVDMYCSS